MANIGSKNDLTDKGNGVYQMNFNGTPNRGFVTSDNNVLAPLWYCKIKMKFGTDWNWGSDEYGGTNQYLANNKFLRFWNPGNTPENCYLEFSARSANGEFKFAREGGDNITNYIGNNLKDVFKAGTTHVLEYEFKENSYFRLWLNGSKFGEVNGFSSNKTGLGKRVYCLGLENEWNSGTKYGNNTLTISELMMEENKTRDQIGTTPPITPPTEPPPTTPVYALKSELDAVNADLQALKQKLRSV